MTEIQIYQDYPSASHLHPLTSTSIYPPSSSTHYALTPSMASPVHKQPPPYYYTPAPPSSHSPQHHSHSHSHSHSQASTPFTTASSVHSPPLSHQLTHPTSAIGYPPFNPYPEHPTSNGHSHSYSSSGGYHHSTPYDGYTVAGQNALQLQPPPLDTSVSYHPSVPSAGAGGASSYIPTRPSPLQHSHSQRITPGVQQLSGRGQPAGTTHPPTGVNTLPPVGSGASGVSTGASAPATAQGQSASAAANVVGADGQAVRKRPKYTRSKAGCLICRQKKVKCDEKKPTCTRCLHGHRECSWPKDVSTSAANRNKAAKSVRGVGRDGDDDTRSDDIDDDEPPQSAGPAMSPIQQPLSAVSSYVGDTPTTASTSGGFGAPGASYSYPYGAQGVLRQPIAQTITSQAHSRNNSSGSSGIGYSFGAPEAGPEPLAPYFRTGQERNLIKHFCHHSANIIMALPPHPNPVLAVTLPIVLSQPPGTHAPTEALRLALLGVGAIHQAYLMLRARVQGNLTGPSWNNPLNFATEASGMDFGLGDGIDVDDLNVLSGHPLRSPALGASTMNTMEVMLANGGAEDARGLLAFSAMMRLQATRYLALACQNTDEIRSDAALGATMAVVLIDIFSGGHQWMKNIGLAKALITSRGGPDAILNTNRPTKMKFGGGVTVSAARFWLEMLAVYETFGSLTSGEEPTLLAPGNTDWWTNDPSAGYHANSIEKVFGMARSMVLLIAKVSLFLCRGIRERAVISEVGPNEEESGLLHFGNADLVNDTIMDFDFDKWLNDIGAASTPGAATFLSPAPAPANQEMSVVPALPALGEALLAPPTAVLQPPIATGTFVANETANPTAPFGVVMGAGPSAGTFGFAAGTGGPGGSSGLGFAAPDPRLAGLQAFFNDAKILYAEVDGWQDMVPLENRDARVLAGNKTHQLAMQIVILRDIFHVNRLDPRVQEFAARILELCVECAEQSMGIDLTWPVIISGSQVQDSYHRQQVNMAFDYFRKQCCFEIESSQRIVTEVWRRMDAGEPRDDWRSVVEDLGLRILVL